MRKSERSPSTPLPLNVAPRHFAICARQMISERWGVMSGAEAITPFRTASLPASTNQLLPF